MILLVRSLQWLTTRNYTFCVSCVRIMSTTHTGGVRDVLCFDMNGTGVVNHVWFTMGGGMAAHTVLSFFVDDEIIPSIAFTPTLGLASDAPEDRATPWGTDVSDCHALQQNCSIARPLATMHHGVSIRPNRVSSPCRSKMCDLNTMRRRAIERECMHAITCLLRS